MDPKSGKSVRLFNPVSIWTDLALKSGGAMLDAAQAAIARPKPKVAVIHAEDAPPRKAARPKAARRKASARPKVSARPKASKAKAKSARKNASSRAKRRGR